MSTIQHALKAKVGLHRVSEITAIVASIIGKKDTEVRDMDAGEAMGIYEQYFAPFGEDIGGSIDGTKLHLGQNIKTLEGEVSSLNLQKPTMRDIMHFPMDEPTFGDYLELAATLSGVPRTFLKNMHLADVRLLVKMVTGFLRSGR